MVGGHKFLSHHFNFINDDGNDFLALLDGSRNELKLSAFQLLN